MSRWQWYRFFRLYGNSRMHSLRKAAAIGVTPVRIYPKRREIVVR